MMIPYLAILIVWLYCVPSMPAMARQPLFEAFKPIIVLDPGHGGVEIGARGADGTEEKTVALALAKLIATEFQQNYRVKLTRTDDYQVDLANRTALANHLKAAVFISLHTGGSLVYSSAGPKIYYHEIIPEPVFNWSQNLGLQGGKNRDATPWDSVQNNYLMSSRVLAQMVGASMSNLSYFKNIALQGAPLVVLQGAQMPAILIEIGYLTNPTEESNLGKERYLKDIAAKISLGIKNFLTRKDKMNIQ